RLGDAHPSPFRGRGHASISTTEARGTHELVTDRVDFGLDSARALDVVSRLRLVEILLELDESLAELALRPGVEDRFLPHLAAGGVERWLHRSGWTRIRHAHEFEDVHLASRSVEELREVPHPLPVRQPSHLSSMAHGPVLPFPAEYRGIDGDLIVPPSSHPRTSLRPPRRDRPRALGDAGEA